MPTSQQNLIKEPTTRTFLGIPLPEETAHMLYASRQYLRESWAGVKWISLRNYHITLHFIGDVPNADIPTLIKAIAPILDNVKPFPVKFAGIGTFGPKHSPRVLLEKIADDDGILQSLRLALAPALALHNRKLLNENTFRPHVSLGRAKSNRAKRIEGILKKTSNHSKIIGFQADRVVLFKSLLLPTGAEYAPIHIFPEDRKA